MERNESCGRIHHRPARHLKILGDCDPARVHSINFQMEWPPYSGQKREFPEVDRAAFFNLEEAQKKIIPAQAAFVQELLRKLNEKA